PATGRDRTCRREARTHAHRSRAAHRGEGRQVALPGAREAAAGGGSAGGLVARADTGCRQDALRREALQARPSETRVAPGYRSFSDLCIASAATAPADAARMASCGPGVMSPAAHTL